MQFQWASKNNKKIKQLNITKRKRALGLKAFVYKLPKFRGRHIRARRVV
jgi:hypothetical protein